MTAGERAGGVLAALAGRARRAAAGEDTADASARVRTASGRWLLIHGSVLGDEPGPRTVVILEPIRPIELAPLIADAFGLTDRERAITELVAQGSARRRSGERLSSLALDGRGPSQVHFEKAGVGTGASRRPPVPRARRPPLPGPPRRRTGASGQPRRRRPSPTNALRPPGELPGARQAAEDMWRRRRRAWPGGRRASTTPFGTRARWRRSAPAARPRRTANSSTARRDSGAWRAASRLVAGRRRRRGAMPRWSRSTQDFSPGCHAGHPGGEVQTAAPK